MWTGGRNGSNSQPEKSQLTQRMYRIIGADGKEYGPVPLEQLKQWLTEGRLNLQSQVRPEGATDWMALGSVPEFQATPQPAFTPLLSAAAPNFESAKQQVLPPAIFILVLSALNILAGLLSLALGAAEGALAGLAENPDAAEQLESILGFAFSLPVQLLGIAIAITCLIGAIRMLSLKSHNFAMVTAILMLIPCGTCCCFLNIGAGVWALIVLGKPEVKAAFQ